ncbi:HYR domain-containing protein, partial [Flavobacterium sp.]|uniref:beta strand repeat-containing protein n=1 Tax=Flavobacterium sp. TaxID=239 RepID=UPI0025C55650
MKKILRKSRIFAIVVVIANLFFSMAAFAQEPTVTLDQADLDYAPGETVYITGTGWKPGEIVTLEVANLTNPDVDCGAVTPEPHVLWTTIADEAGNFTASWYVNDCELGAQLFLEAYGKTSGFTFEIFFTDAGPTSGIYESYIVLNKNNTGNNYYDLQATTNNADFNGNNLGVFCNNQSLIIAGGQNKTYKELNNGNGNQCNVSDGNLYYRVYPTGSPSGSFLSINLPFDTNLNVLNGNGSQNQQWGQNGVANPYLTSPNLLNSLADGNYTIEVYTTASYNSCSGNNPNSGTLYSSNLGANYKATFTVNSNLDYVNLQSPPTATICQGGSLTAYGQVYEPGLTPGNGLQGAGIVAEFGYNTTNTNPSTWTNWATASFNAAGGGANNDEYQYTFTPPTSGTYYYAFRYKLNECSSYQYGGYTSTGGGFWGGLNVSGMVTVNIVPIITTTYSDISVNNDAGQCGAVVNYDAAVATGTPAPIITYSMASGSIFPIGTTTVTVMATNGCGEDTRTFDVTVTDNEKPTITCNAPITVNNDSGVCGAVVTYSNSSTDNCPGQTIVQTAGLASGSVFPIGTTTNTFVVTDASGNTATCSYDVTVTDNEKPTITCNAPITVNNDSGVCGAVVTYSNSSTDNCPGQTIVQTAGLASGSVFPIGTTTNTFVVTDASGNTATCSFDVTVTDNEKPTITCNAPISVNNDSGVCGAVVTYSNSSTDNCPGQTIVQTAGLASGSVFPIGTTTNTFVVTDASGNTATCSFDVTVTDNELPIAIAQDITIQLNAAGTATITAADINNGSADNCGIKTLTVSPSNFACANLGNNTVTLTVTDNNNNVKTATATVTVQDVTPPTVLTKNIIVNLDASGNATITPAQVDNGSNDGCGAVILTSVSPNTFNCSNVTASAPAPSVWINEIHYDNSGTNDTNEFIEIAGNAGINLANYAIVRYNGSNSTAAVIYTSPSQTTSLSGLMPNQSNGFGTFAVSFATDGIQNGPNDGVALVNTSTNTVVQLLSYEGLFTVASGQGLASGQTSTNLPYSEGGSLAGGSLKLSGSGNKYSDFVWQPESSPASPGVINNSQSFVAASSGVPVTLTVTDASGNSATGTANVTVLDNLAPIVSAPTPVDLECNTSLPAAATTMTQFLALAGVTASDNCTLTANLTLTSSTGSLVGTNCNGTITRIYTLKDASNNSTSVNHVFTVTDNTPPTAIAQNSTVQLNAAGTVSITANQVNNGSTDNCGVVTLVSVVPSSFTCANVGPNTVTLTVKDACNNESTATATITVEDKVLPTVITQNITVNLDASGSATITPAQVNNGSTDACGIASLAVSPNVFSCSDVNGDALTELFISEYIEGSGNIKAIEIYNGTSNSINLSSGNYAIRFYSNGSSSISTSISLTGTVAPGDVYILATSDASAAVLAQADQTSSTSFYNGDDAVALVHNGVNIDIIGQIGVDPGTEWGSGIISTADNTLRRKSTISSGDNNGSDVFVPSLEWDGYATDNTAGLGSHVLSAVPNIVTLTVTDVNGNSASKTAKVTVKDEIIPTFTRPADITIYTNATCTYDASVAVTADVTNEWDNCSTTLNATFTDVTVAGTCQGSKVITRTWHLVDTNGNAAADQVQTITVSDNTLPTFTRPADITLYKDAACAVNDTPTGLALDVTNEADNCSTVLNATYSDVKVDNCQGTYTITRTWSLVDNCGNAAV